MNAKEQPARTDRGPSGLQSTSNGGAAESRLSAGLAEPPADPEIPARFGRYRILKRLGQGGMGSVYLAHDTELDRQVALKVPRLGTGNRPRLIERFYREARAAATLNHPNLCPVHDVGAIDGTPYLTMAFVEGRPLADYLQSGKGLPPRQAATLVRKLALALAEAHARGVVHRDLKPANVMINQRKEPVVMDFGLARLDAEEGTRLTQLGAILGTPSHMAPEQVAARLDQIGPASDIYSLGVILYETLTGRLPFEGPLTAVLGQILAVEPEPPTKHRPELDPRLEAICLKAMAKNVADRHASMTELAAALQEYLRTAPTAGGPEPLIGEARPGTQRNSTLVEAGPPPLPKSTVPEARRPSTMIEPRPPAGPAGPGRPARRRLSGKVLLGSGLALVVLAAAVIVTLAIIRVQTKIGTVVLDIPESGAEVSIDGQHRITVTDPNTKEPIQIEVEEGKHELKVTKGGFKTYTQGFDVTKGDKTVLTVRLEPEPKLKLDPDPAAPPKKDPPPDSVAPPKKDPPPDSVAPPKKDPPPAPAKGQWVSLMPTAAEAAGTDFAEYKDGVLSMDGDVYGGFGSQRLGVEAENAILRVVVKKLAGQSITLLARGGKKGGFYQTHFNGGGFGVGKMVRRDGEWKFLHLGYKEFPGRFNDFFEYTFKVEGDLLTVEADGTEVLRVRDSEITGAGEMKFLPYKGKGLFKKAEMKVLDK